MRSSVKTDLTRTNLLDAVERLATRGSMSGITMRAIADEAECSLGLAYRYFGAKDELLGAVLDRAAEYITEGFGPYDPPGDLAQQAWERMAERPVFARLFAWLVLERRDITGVMTGHPFLAVAAQQAALAGDGDPKTAAAALGIIVLGGGVFAPALNRAAGLQPDDDAVYERLLRAVVAIHIPSDQTPSPAPFVDQFEQQDQQAREVGP